MHESNMQELAFYVVDDFVNVPTLLMAVIRQMNDAGPDMNWRAEPDSNVDNSPSVGVRAEVVAQRLD